MADTRGIKRRGAARGRGAVYGRVTMGGDSSDRCMGRRDRRGRSVQLIVCVIHWIFDRT